MAAGDPFGSPIVDAWLFQLLTNDAMAQSLLPGGVFAAHPPQGKPVTGSPCWRFWAQTPGRNVVRQGDVKRILARPSYVICGLDRQKGGQFSWAGTNSNLVSAQLYLYRLIDDFDGAFSFGGYTYKINAIIRSDYKQTESDAGDLLAMLGIWVDLKIQ